ncbi:MAG: type IX secretion system membrane protein PorP/SprF [Saprospiraceae bacterium]
MRKLHCPTGNLFTLTATAQQEQMYTQFMYNKLAYNPGSAGSFVSPTLTAVYRHQWIGLEGAQMLRWYLTHSPC